jgi:hypothetical protein
MRALVVRRLKLRVSGLIGAEKWFRRGSVGGVTFSQFLWQPRHIPTSTFHSPQKDD